MFYNIPFLISSFSRKTLNFRNYIAKKMGLDAYGVSSDLRYYSKKQYYREAREWLARVKSFIKCIAKPEPKYLGDSIDLKASGDVTND